MAKGHTKKSSGMRLATRFVLAFAVVLTPLCIVLGLQQYKLMHAAHDKRLEAVENALRLSYAPIQERVTIPQRLSRIVAPMTDLPTADCDRTMALYVAGTSRVDRVAVYGPDGARICGFWDAGDTLPLDPTALPGEADWTRGWSREDGTMGVYRRLQMESGDLLYAEITFPARKPVPAEFEATRVELSDGALIAGDEIGPHKTNRVMTIQMHGSNLVIKGLLSKGALTQTTFMQLAAAFAVPLFTLIAGLALAWWLAERLSLYDLRGLSRDMESFRLHRTMPAPFDSQGHAAEVSEMRESFEAMVEQLLHEEALTEDALKHRDLVFRELYHRVGNNFQTILSIISLSKRHTDDPTTIAMLSRIQDRVRDMDVVHQMLHQTEGAVLMRADRVIARLATRFSADHAQELPGLMIETDLDALDLGIRRIFPLAYVLSETLSNCLSAFRARNAASSLIRISLKRRDAGTACLCIDNGPFESAPDLEQEGVGRLLIRAFVRELAGTKTLDFKDGMVRLHVTFPLTSA